MDRDVRRLIAFACEGATLIGTLDAAAGDTGVLIVSGGNEVRAGAHRGMTTLARDLAMAGVPAFRFDRRGIGDSAGDRGGWETSGPDIVAAARAFRAAQPQIDRLVGFGNCDGATALALFGSEAGIDAVVLANPWLDDTSPLPPPAAIRRRYARALFSPTAWGRLASGPRAWRKLATGLRHAVAPAGRPPSLTGRLAAALVGRQATIVLARGDRTAQVFAAAWRAELPVRTIELPTDSHSFVGMEDRLAATIMTVVGTTTDPAT